jgi:hypothetical protein
MSEAEIGWLAGILEGEGTFLSGQGIGIHVTMTDLDIIERLQAVTGLGHIYVLALKKEHYKQSWCWAVQRRAHIRHVITAVPPWLGTRRTIAAIRLFDRIADCKDRAA